ncbi:MAG: hypothetical protein Q4E11_05045 [Corynebacterium sp.]|uniref:DUF6802 family protein n=1 Tax=Corynebacterium sp. TaxID=1720 RepID=UPI0026DD08D3|nr:DUF6802 family protein [Corynebacterium sp.]MDO5029934.1 hypothetical protein [Corynebacterium sp.]
MAEFSLLQYFSEQPVTDGVFANQPAGMPCGLDGATPIDSRLMDVDGAGLVVEIDGQLYDLGDDEGSITLADDSGLSIYSDLDGDGTVDHVTTVRFDGTWESWSADQADGSGAESASGDSAELAESVGQWDAYSWERDARGSWR